MAGLFALVLAVLMLGWRGPVPPLHTAHTSFLTTHLLLELFAVAISVLIGTVAWHAEGVRERGSAVAAIGGFLVVGSCDLAHALTYERMPAFLGAGSTPKAIFFWLMGRSAEVLTLLTPRTWPVRDGRRQRSMPSEVAAAPVAEAAGTVPQLRCQLSLWRRRVLRAAARQRPAGRRSSSAPGCARRWTGRLTCRS